LTVEERLAAAGFVAAGEEAQELAAAAGGDDGRLEAMLRRRLTGEPLAWITGRADLCGVQVRVDPGVYVPRWQTEPLAERAAERLPAEGLAVDVCTGSGAVARVLSVRRPGARVIATDVDRRAVACARANSIDALLGDLLAPLPGDLGGRVDVIVGVVPYVPTPELGLLQRDTFTFESERSYDGGPDGAALLRRVVAESPPLLRPGGALLLELGGAQAEGLRGELARHGFGEVRVLADEDGDVRGIEAVLERR
jgi:release factor glutamine methyltransferase